MLVNDCRLQLDKPTCEENHASNNNASQGGAVKKPLFALSLVAILAWSAITSSAHAKEAEKPAPLPIERMRAVAYTKEFAKRFALPDPEPGTEPEGGLQAMEFAVEPGKFGNPRYYCKLSLYLNSQLAIAYPEEGMSGSTLMFNSHLHFFARLPEGNKRWSQWSVEDRKHFNERQTLYTNHVWLATPDYPGYFDERSKKPFAATSMFYDEYHRDLFPGLAYLKIDMGCPAYSWLDKVEAIQIWIKWEGAKDYSRELRKDPADFLKFSLPMSFYKKIISPIKVASGYNSKILNEDIRQNREKRMHESDKYLKEMFKESKQAK